MMSHWTIEGTITLDTPLHIGIGKGGKTTDSPVRRNGRGEILLPGRALGGSLRTLATRLAPHFFADGVCEALRETATKEACDCVVCALFGTVRLSQDEDNVGHASSLWVYDAVKSAESYVRDGVGIDRSTGAAARNVKYDYEVVPAGTQFDVRMRLQLMETKAVTEREMQIQQLLTLTLSEWEAGRGQLGGGTARGLGRFTLSDLTVQGLAIQNADDLITFLEDDEVEMVYKSADWLTAAKQLPARAVTDKTLPFATDFVTVKFEMRFADLFLINDPLTAFLSGFDHAPLVTLLANGDAKEPVLSGSSLRGALRSHAEKIGRTLATHYAKDGDHFLEICPAPDPFAGKEDPLLAWHRSQFLTANDGERRKLPDELPPDAFHLSERLFGNQLLGSRLWVRDAPYVGKPNKNSWKAQDFLAIDPFTGGGKDGAKFDAAALQNGVFSAELMLHSPTDWELGWLLLTLRDIADGMVTFGFGAAKGYGVPALENVRWEIGCVLQDGTVAGVPLNDAKRDAGVYFVVEKSADDVLPSEWRDTATGWITAFNELVKNPGYEDRMHFKKDTYFTTKEHDPGLEKLYSKATAEVVI